MGHKAHVTKDVGAARPRSSQNIVKELGREAEADEKSLLQQVRAGPDSDFILQPSLQDAEKRSASADVFYIRDECIEL